MKLETCVYSGYKIHPGHGKRIVRVDGKVSSLPKYARVVLELGEVAFPSSGVELTQNQLISCTFARFIY